MSRPPPPPHTAQAARTAPTMPLPQLIHPNCLLSVSHDADDGLVSVLLPQQRTDGFPGQIFHAARLSEKVVFSPLLLDPHVNLAAGTGKVFSGCLSMEGPAQQLLGGPQPQLVQCALAVKEQVLSETHGLVVGC
ncbi:unnamed protein product [Mycena citricolor]|uniref:Uncharacterized protein n=2 Tax=Mycena citricolor TaxID=2018698 RepID=A0AAD2Q711_9AGAR|nr:unnamed protein product [Mycena citricolor]